MAENTIGRRELMQTAGALGVSLSYGGVSAAVFQDTENAQELWYQKPYRIVQTNLREPDILEDPRRIARQVREFGADAIITNIGGIVAFYPTDLEYQYRNPFMEEGVDFVREMIDAARAEDLAVIGRFDLSKAMKIVYDAHPDWFMVTPDGEPREYEGTYRACPNGAWANDYGIRILREGLGRYHVDGVFFNMSGYPTRNYDHVDKGSCRCQNCRRRFREMYGLELPEQDSFDDPVWPQYLEFQDRTVEELNEKNHSVIKSILPNAGVFGRHMYNEVVRYETQRRIYRTGPEWAYQSGEQARRYQALIPGKPFSSTSAAHVDYPWRQALESPSYHMVRFAQQLGAGAQLDLYLMGTFDDQDDRRFVKPVSNLFKWYGQHTDHYEGVKPSARVAIYNSMRTQRWGGGVPSGQQWSDGFRGVYTALVDRRIPFWFISDKRVEDGTTKLSPDDYDVIILPGVAILTDAEAAALDAYVEAGGIVIATGQTGAYGGLGAKRKKMALQSSPIASYDATLDAHGWSWDAALVAEIDLAPARIPATGPYYTAALAEGVDNLLSRAPNQRFGPPELSYALPDAKRGEEPGVLVRKVGKGVSIHMPWRPDVMYYRQGLPDHARLFAALIEKYAPPAPVKLEGSGPVELMVMKQPLANRLLIHVVNYSGQRNGLYEKPALIHDLRIGVRGGGEAETLVDGKRLGRGKKGSDGYRWYSLPPVNYFEALTVAVD